MSKRSSYADYAHLLISGGRKHAPKASGTNTDVNGIDRRGVENTANELREARALGMTLAQYRAEVVA
jgi:hypothetical protein